MTYWYPGVIAAINLAREHFPGVPVILGGIYASLCPEHAQQHTGADRVVTGPGEAAILGILEEVTGFSPPVPIFPDPEDLDAMPYPALDLLEHPSFIPILTSRGCPLDCTYCASRAAPADIPAARPPGGGGRADLLAGPAGASRTPLSTTTPCCWAPTTTSW